MTDYIPFDRDDHRRRRFPTVTSPSASLGGFEVIYPPSWQGQPLPEREWIVPDWIPSRNVTMLSGDGGAGKTILALQLMVTASLGQHWLGMPAKRVKALGVFCEDDEGELRRRLGAIAEHYGAGFEDLESLSLVARVGFDNTLVFWENQWAPGEETDLFSDIMNQCVDGGVQLLVLDSLHDFFAGNENARPQARRFVNALRTIALECEGAVLLTAHPSRSGRSTGTGEAGSTAWNNAVRSRLYLTSDDDGDRDARVLRRVKANYVRGGDELRLFYREGVFVPPLGSDGILDAIDKQSAETIVLDAIRDLASRNVRLSEKARAPNYAPRTIIKAGKAPGRQAQELERAMWKMIDDGRLILAESGPPSRRYTHLEVVQSEEPD